MEKREALIRLFKLRVKIWKDVYKLERIIGEDIRDTIDGYDIEIENIIRDVFGVRLEEFEEEGWEDYVSDVLYYLATEDESDDDRGIHSVEELVDEILKANI